MEGVFFTGKRQTASAADKRHALSQYAMSPYIRITFSRIHQGAPMCTTANTRLTRLHFDRHLDRFSRFCWIHNRNQQTDGQTGLHADRRTSLFRMKQLYRLHLVNVAVRPNELSGTKVTRSPEKFCRSCTNMQF